MRSNFSLIGGSIILTLVLAGCTNRPAKVEPTIVIKSSEACPVTAILGDCSDLNDATSCKKLVKLRCERL